jgi:chloride channel 7
VGIIIAVICSNWVGEAIHSDGIYETDLEADGSVIFLRPSPPPALFAKTAGQIASKPVWCTLCPPVPRRARTISTATSW